MIDKIIKEIKTKSGKSPEFALVSSYRYMLILLELGFKKPYIFKKFKNLGFRGKEVKLKYKKALRNLQ